MVLLIVKQQERTLFLYETKTDIRIGQLVEELLDLDAMRNHMSTLMTALDVDGIGELADADLLSRAKAELRLFAGEKLGEALVPVTGAALRSVIDSLKVSFGGKPPPQLTPLLEPVRETDRVLWFAGKELSLEKLLRDYIGPNEKSKVTVKLHRRGCGPPVREPALSEQLEREMMAHAFRREQQLQVKPNQSPALVITKFIDHRKKMVGID